jgi:hypothetical protein
MSYDILFGGESASGYISSGTRVEKLCMPGQEWEVALGLDCPTEILPWTSVEIYEDGQKVLTGYVANVGIMWDEGARKIVAGLDTWKRALDCWNTEEYVTGEGDTIQGLIRRFLDMAGLSYQINTDYDDSVPPGMSILYQPVSEIVTDLCAALGLFIRINVDGWVIIGDVISDGGTGKALDDEFISYDLLESDYRSRNKIIVWGPNGLAVVRSDEDWAEVDHTLVYASPYCYDAWALANRIWSNLHTVEQVQTIDHPGDPDRRVGQEVNITAPRGLFSGKEICTTIKSSYDQSGYIMQSIFGERCAIFGAGPIPIDGRDVIVLTYESGLWRCKDIWADTPHWEPLNIGLSETNIVAGVGDVGSSYDGEWFIRDPYEPNTLAYLLTGIGILETNSLEPGYENWTPTLYNHNFWETTSPGSYGPASAYISKIRSTVAERGVYYLAVWTNRYGYDGMHIGGTYDGFDTHFGGPGYNTIPNSPWGPAARPPTNDVNCDWEWSDLWGNCNYGNQKEIGVGSWHGPRGGYIEAGAGGLAAWHRNAEGCTITGLHSAPASTAEGTAWDCRRTTVYYGGKSTAMNAVVAPAILGIAGATQSGCDIPIGNWWCCFNIGSPLTPNDGSKNPAGTRYLSWGGGAPWLFCPTLHIPYDQTYDETGPEIIYYSPGYISGGSIHTPTRNITPLYLPWGTDPADCHDMQGSIGTYSPDRTKVACFSKGKPSRFAISNDEGDSWEEKTSVPVKTSCFSGFPYSSAKVYAGRHPTRDPSGAGDTALIYVSWDRGGTWTDVTGDLWDQTQALELRTDPISGEFLGTAGLLTIAPRYS